jgi:hypothetical protein
MAYSDSTHFSDKLSYKILCFLSYQLKDMILARFEHLQQFTEKQIKGGTFLSEGNQPKSLTGRAKGC